MMRTLVLIRHAKAEAHSSADIGRALAERGLLDAAALGKWLGALGITPDAVVVSPARRARQTWALAAAEMGGTPEPITDDRIYENSFEALLDVIHDAPDAVETLVLAGHNPSMHAVAANLDDGTGEAQARLTVSRDFPTSAVAVFTVTSSWAAVDAGTARLIAAAAPRG
jgi:phosphohistidine phosphatase